ncbi:transcriptional regulator CRZ1-like [Homarus americanus]|uniref:transcriptional regulator CRZ1-like n=1 Tax=Homarus americanus TaxID=6706 RepID=UPI001C49263E|nr:transcriptional regulator CRZ1-like [Homarus americanus]XP_042222149.1 transcriptional regulator CRZ1-like [Homarus americanus]XP_042222150.1 transcriptional regulator CRZ1-like [Homarus americanus]XP_042222151.1 transcriptional regulator CRZ1-like [Homarus americanus]
MKFYPQPADSPDGVHAWVHEDLLEPRYGAHATDTKTTMDPLDSFLRDLPAPNSTFAELKPLEPLDYLTASPDTSASSRHDTSSTSSNSPGSQYKGAITNSNTFLGYTGTPEPVTTTTSPLSSSQKHDPHHHGYSITQEIDDIATILGSAIADNNINTSINSIMLPESLEPLNAPEFQDIEEFFENMSGGVKVEPADPLVNSTMSPSGHSPSMATQVPQPSTTTITHSTIEYANSHTHSPMLTTLLAAGAVTNNNYLQGLVSEAQYKNEISMPILQARLTQGLKDVGGGLLKADPMFARAQYYTHKDAMPHTTDHTNFAVTTTDDLFINKFDTRSYLDKTQLASPESTDLSSTKMGLDFPGLKNKNRNRMNKSTKLPITTEGTKDKPVHRCTVCNRGFLNKSNIKVHLRTHTGEKPFKCETCGKAFRQKAHLLKHYQIHKRVARD